MAASSPGPPAQGLALSLVGWSLQVRLACAPWTPSLVFAPASSPWLMVLCSYLQHLVATLRS